jgi:hypothetical protein
MEQKTQKNGLINLLALVLVGGAGFAIARFGNTYAGLVGSVFLGIGALVAAVSWFQMRLEHREQLEKFEFEELPSLLQVPPYSTPPKPKSSPRNVPANNSSVSLFRSSP